MNLWTPPDGEYAKQKALKEKQASCEHHLHLRDAECESRSLPVHAVRCCKCKVIGTITQEEARFCGEWGAIVVGSFNGRT